MQDDRERLGADSERHREPAAAPRFCRSCNRAHASERELCPDCGDRLEPQGYCPVCERFWTLPVGWDCPKHEIALEAAPPPKRRLSLSGRDSWVTVASYIYPHQAEAARLRLDAEGIPSFLDGQRMAANTAYQFAVGGVRLQVPRSSQQDARILLAQSWSVPADDDEHEDEVDWDELPDAAPEAPTWHPVLLWSGVLLLLLIVAGLVNAF